KGKFPKQRIAPERSEPADPSKPTWTNQGLYDYSWYTVLPKFHRGIAKLLALASVNDCAMMCCEGPWYKCHRSMIADCVVFYGGDVRHIPGHKMHSAALGNRLDRYDTRIIEAWKGAKGT